MDVFTWCVITLLYGKVGSCLQYKLHHGNYQYQPTWWMIARSNASFRSENYINSCKNVRFASKKRVFNGLPKRSFYGPDSLVLSFSVVHFQPTETSRLLSIHSGLTYDSNRQSKPNNKSHPFHIILSRVCNRLVRLLPVTSVSRWMAVFVQSCLTEVCVYCCHPAFIELHLHLSLTHTETHDSSSNYSCSSGA